MSLVIFLVSIPASGYRAMSPAEMPNVQLADSTRFVSDPESLLSPATRAKVDARLLDLRRKTTVEMAVAVVPDLGDQDIESYSEELFTSWGLGHKDKDNGLLFVISPGSRKVRIQTGYGVEEAIPDMIADRIIRHEVIPQMKKDDLNGAVDKATEEIVNILSDEQYADALRSGTSIRNTQQDAEAKEIREVFLGLCAIVVFLSLVSGIYILFKTMRTTRHSSTYHRAEVWRSTLRTLGILAVTSAGVGIIMFLIAYSSYRRNRDHSRQCPRCGTKMQKLDEETDNQYLSPAQDLEERLGSVDYDVWRCPECGEVERYAFNEPKSKFEKCNRCGTKAYHLACIRTLQEPTLRREGQGEREFRCEYCGNIHKVPFRIPRKTNDGALLAAGAALGAASRRRGGGGFGGGFGGFGGGGFGGGSTGGGGASGSW